MQAIRTRYIGTTNTRGSRIQAKCEARTLYVPYDHALDAAGNHKAAHLALVRTLGWGTDSYADLVGGEFAGDTYWVFDDKRLKAMRDLVNSIRSAEMRANPWCNPKFLEAVRVCGSAVGYYGDPADAPTQPEEIAVYLAQPR